MNPIEGPAEIDEPTAIDKGAVRQTLVPPALVDGQEVVK
jgi:hypothetical protein